MLDCIQIFVAPLHIKDRQLLLIESKIIQLLYSLEGQPGKFQEPDFRRVFRKENEEPVEVSVKPSGIVFGLPEKFVV